MRILRGHGWMAAGFAAALVVPGLVGAQDAPVTRAVPARSASASMSGESTTPHQTAADTGRMMWGHQNFSTYTTAQACDRAIMDVAHEVWRTGARDTLPYTLATDTLPSSATAVAHLCGPRFNVAAADTLDLWSLLRISLALGNASQAGAAVSREVSLATTPANKAYVYLTAMQNYLDGHPPQLAPAQDLMRRLDALGAGAVVERYQAHVLLMHYWHIVYNTDSLRSEAQVALTLLKSMTQDQQDQQSQDYVFAPYREMIWSSADKQDFTGERKLIDQGLADVGAWHEGKGSDFFARADRLLQTQTAVIGKHTKALAGTHWYNDGGIPHPASGKVSLIVHVDHSCGLECFPLYALVRRLHAQYGNDLDLTLITDTRGYAPGSGPLLPEEEVKQVSSYFLDFLKMPTALLIDETPHTKRADGHIEYGTSAIGDMFDGWQLINSILVDRTGKIAWIGMVATAEDARMIQTVIERALGQTPGAAAPGAGSSATTSGVSVPNKSTL